MIWAWLTSRIAQIATVLAAMLAAIGFLRRDARKDERAEQKEVDRDRADEIRRRVDASRRNGVHLEDDDRGYRD